MCIYIYIYISFPLPEPLPCNPAAEPALDHLVHT